MEVCFFMYNTQEIANRIKRRAKEKNCSLKDLLSELQLSINSISHLAKGQQVSFLTIAKIADYLDCSVDYLLGRTPDPESHKKKPVLMVENEPRYLVRRAGRDGSFSEEYLTKEEIEKIKEEANALEEADF